MAIAPISSVLSRNYNIGFTSLKTSRRKNDDSNYRTSYIKAIPLATMLAMSPLNAVTVNSAEPLDTSHNIELVETTVVSDVDQTQRKIVASKEFPYNNRSNAKVRVDLVNTTGGAGFDKVELVYTSKLGKTYDDGEFNNYVKDITTYNFTVISDDGVNQGTLPYNVITTGAFAINADIPLVHDDVAKYIKEQLANNPKKNVIPMKTVGRTISPTLGGGFQNNKKTVNINQAEGLNIDNSEYTKAASSRIIQGENDEYTIHFYKSKTNGRPLVTCEKSTNPGEEFRVALVGDFSATIGKDEYSQVVAKYKMIVLRNDNDGFGLMDTTLGRELQNIKDSNLCKGAFICPAVDYDYKVLGKGVLANVTE